MGNVTTVKILNDYAGNIREYGATFTNLLCDRLSSGKTGEVIPGVTITDMRHLDDTLRARIWQQFKGIDETELTKLEKNILRILKEK